MSEISDMIQRLCPDGVEYRKLGEVCSVVSAPKKIDKGDYQSSGMIPIVDQGKKLVIGYTNDCYATVPKGCYVIFGDHTREIKYVDFDFAQGADGVKILKANNHVDIRYLFHAMTNLTIPSRGYNRHWTIARDLEIPVPPLEVQRKIVEVLDNFSELTAELTAELEARKKQYEYYRDNLLNFSQIAPNSVKWMKISEVFEIRNGYTPSKAKAEFWESGTIPWFRMEDIRQNGRILSDSILHITSEGVKGKGLFKANSFILATTATIGEHALIIADSLANQQFTNLKICKSLEKELTIKYVFYYLFVVDEWCKANTNVSGFASVDMAKFKNLLFPIPPLSEQERIVSILDRFESLTTDLTSGLPAEIKARQQQYEYYRDQLLTFKRAN